jgi:ubiquinone/menaquinone biosynthesis C-methylase UbiE
MIDLYRKLVRWGFRRLYHEFAWTYDAVAWLVSAGLWRQWAATALPFLHGRVLELGFGPGHLQLALAARPQHAAVGLDRSPQMVAQAAGRLRRHGVTPHLVQGTALSLPFAAASFDTVLATFPAEYILAPETAAEIRRVLTPAGHIVIVDGAQLPAGGLYMRLVDLAYRLTLQAPVRRAPADDPQPQERRYGPFILTAQQVSVGASTVQVFVGTAGYGANA